MNKTIAVIRGDGIGPEIVDQALLVLDRISGLYGHEFTYIDVDMGGCAIDKYGDPLPEEMLQKCLAADSVLLGAVGGPKWNQVPGPMRPEKGLLRLRAGMEVYSNNRPAKIWPQLASASPLKSQIVEKGIDFLIVRELTGGIYFGRHDTFTEDGRTVAVDELRYSEDEIRRIGRIEQAAETPFGQGHAVGHHPPGIAPARHLAARLLQILAHQHLAARKDDQHLGGVDMRRNLLVEDLQKVGQGHVRNPGIDPAVAPAMAARKVATQRTLPEERIETMLAHLCVVEPREDPQRPSPANAEPPFPHLFLHSSVAFIRPWGPDARRAAPPPEAANRDAGAPTPAGA